MNKLQVTSSEFIGKPETNVKSTIWTDFTALIKVGIINSNLITAFGGFWLALYFMDAVISEYWLTLLLVMAGTALVIAGGCVLNNFYDRDIDPVMQRTKNRPTVTGTISLKTTLILGIGFSVSGLILLSFTTIQAAFFGALGWFTYVVLYTMWSKRRYTINTAIGSLSGAVPPLIGWTAVNPELNLAAFALFLIMFIWQTPHFLALAMKKTKEYRAAGIPMLPVVHGFAMTKRQMAVYVICLLPLPFYLSSLGWVFIIIATLLNIGWFLLSIKGFFTKNDMKWANYMFIYSLNYLVIIFGTMVIVTLPAVIN